MSVFISFDASGMDALAHDLEVGLARVRRTMLKRGQRLMAEAVDQAFLSRGYPGGVLTGPTLDGSEPKREKGGQWKKHRPATVRSRAQWAKKNGPPAGEELRLTDALRAAASSTTGAAEGSAAYFDEAAGMAGIGVELSRFPGAAALQWGYAPRNLAPRPFLGMTTTTERQITRESQIELAVMAERVERKFNP